MDKKTILITGGSGFLGRNLALKLKSKYNVFLASRNNKNNVYASKITGCPILPLDVSNIESVRDVLTEVKPNIVIHAAATKFVDLSEKYPMETIDVNVVGSQNIARVCIEKGVEFVVGISTDKACPPVRNIYGLSKATMEKIFCLMDGKTQTRFTCVRYGNVAWSTGSVLPIWDEMFKRDGVLRSTGPKMRRFFFTVDHAVELVLNAVENKEMVSGKILSRVMKSAQISDILDVWTKHFGGKWETMEGRPGERTDEYLVGETELEYCEELIINEVKHYLISPNEKSGNKVDIFHSGVAEKLSEKEILDIIKAGKDVI
ncbi:MAG: polysaccharide biosynthesis protein [Candidatus Thorarchaeota archaeon]|jgi:UDP-glucose 4-epimerase